MKLLKTLLFTMYFLVFVVSCFAAETGHPVKVASLSFMSGTQSVGQIASEISRLGEKGVDLVCLPEAWTGTKPEMMQGETIKKMSSLAGQFNCYIVCPLIIERDGNVLNTSILFDREGQIACVYDKAFPYWSEFEGEYPVKPSQTDVVVYDTDFGRIGFSICFDAKFPEVWQRLRDKGAELVVWSSAYSGGTELQAFSLLHHYYIVTSTWRKDCLVWDITGEKMLDEKSANDIHLSVFELDMDRQIYHYNFNSNKRTKLLKEQDDKVLLEVDLPREEWFVLKARVPGVSARELAKQYGLETLRDYLDRSRTGLDRIRGYGFSEKYGGYPGKSVK